MKKILFPTLAILALSACNFGPSPNEGVDHNNMIVNMIRPADSVFNDLTTVLYDDSIVSKKAFENTLAVFESTIAKIKAVDDFDKKTELKDVAIEYVTALQKTVKTHYQRILEIETSSTFLTADGTSVEYNKLFDEESKHFTDALQEQEIASDIFNQKQLAFSKSYGFQMVDDSIR
jgi:Prokaryotic membrane lipoprotein lipid attachment site